MITEYTPIRRAYEKLVSRNWDFIYFAVDIHETILESNYNGISYEMYEDAITTLKYMSTCPEIKIILFSSCYPEHQKVYIDLFKQHGIRIDYFNRNPEVQNTITGCFDSKFYYDVLLDDKANFDRRSDWKLVDNTIRKYRPC